MMSIKEKKHELRQKLLEQRNHIRDRALHQKSAKICARLKKTPAYKKAEVIHCYVSMNTRREVNTHPLIKAMLAAGKRVVVPLTNMESGTLRHIELKFWDDLHPNNWGVLEPADGEEIPVKDLELVIVPMSGGDRNKNRIGYGKGFYDRFLQHVKCPSIGLLFEQSLLKKIPVEPFDVPLSMLITEDQAIL